MSLAECKKLAGELFVVAVDARGSCVFVLPYKLVRQAGSYISKLSYSL